MLSTSTSLATPFRTTIKGSGEPTCFDAAKQATRLSRVVLGFYTLSMAHAESSQLAAALPARLPRYPMPVALIGRLAVDKRAQGRRLGEKLLIDAIQRVLLAAEILACLGVVVDAKDGRAEGFYGQYGFVTVAAEGSSRRMFLPLSIARASFGV